MSRMPRSATLAYAVLHAAALVAGRGSVLQAVGTHYVVALPQALVRVKGRHGGVLRRGAPQTPHKRRPKLPI